MTSTENKKRFKRYKAGHCIDGDKAYPIEELLDIESDLIPCVQIVDDVMRRIGVKLVY